VPPEARQNAFLEGAHNGNSINEGVFRAGAFVLRLVTSVACLNPRDKRRTHSFRNEKVESERAHFARSEELKSAGRCCPGNIPEYSYSAW